MKATGFNIEIEVMNQQFAHVLVPAEKAMTGFRELLPALERCLEDAFNNMVYEVSAPSDGNRHVVRITIWPVIKTQSGGFV